MKLEPLNDRILVRQDAAATTSASGLALPEGAAEQPQKGEVVAVGPGGFDERGNRIPMTLKAGDRILYAKYAGIEQLVDGEVLQVMREGDVRARILED